MNPVTLHDGRVVDSSGEDWRHECEARALLGWSLARRRDHLYGWKDDGGRIHKGVEQIRGRAEVTRLEFTMLALWINKQGDKLAELSAGTRADHLERLSQNNGHHIIAKIEARVRDILERRKADAANDNTTERAITA